MASISYSAIPSNFKTVSMKKPETLSQLSFYKPSLKSLKSLKPLELKFSKTESVVTKKKKSQAWCYGDEQGPKEKDPEEANGEDTEGKKEEGLEKVPETQKEEDAQRKNEPKKKEAEGANPSEGPNITFLLLILLSLLIGLQLATAGEKPAAAAGAAGENPVAVYQSIGDTQSPAEMANIRAELASLRAELSSLRFDYSREISNMRLELSKEISNRVLVAAAAPERSPAAILVDHIIKTNNATNNASKPEPTNVHTLLEASGNLGGLSGKGDLKTSATLFYGIIGVVVLIVLSCLGLGLAFGLAYIELMKKMSVA